MPARSPAPNMCTAREIDNVPEGTLYREGQVVVDPGWVDCYFYVPLSCPTPPPILPNFHLRKQNEACSGMPKINFNPT